MKEEKTSAQIASEYDVHPNQIGQGKALALKGLPSRFQKDTAVQAAEKAAPEQKLQEPISMDGKERVLYNSLTERRWRSVKYGEVYLHEYDSPRPARRGLSR